MQIFVSCNFAIVALVPCVILQVTHQYVISDSNLPNNITIRAVSKKNIYLGFSRNTEADASDIQDNREEMFLILENYSEVIYIRTFKLIFVDKRLLYS